MERIFEFAEVLVIPAFEIVGNSHNKMYVSATCIAESRPQSQ